MILRFKLPKINQVRFYAEKVIYAPRDSQPAELSYNVGESEYVKKILENYSNKVQYLNTILKCSEDARRERSKKLIDERKELIKLLEDKICTAKSRLISVGSSATGMLFDQGSDIDLCFYTEDLNFYKDFEQHRSLRVYVFNKIRHLVYELRNIDPDLHVVDAVSLIDTSIPIQILTFKKGVSIDIQVPREDFQAIRNTNLVKHYAVADERFSQVYLFIKKLFEVMGLRNSKGGLLSSYHLMMLTIHFLQCRTLSKPVLPVLCSIIPHRVGPDVPIDKVLKLIDGEFGDYKGDWKSKNNQTSAELIFEMINYYRNFFDVNAHQIYISRGLAIKRQLNKNIPTSLQIFDPYSPTSICRSPYISDAFATGIRYIFRCMSYGKFIDTFPHFFDASGFGKYIEDKPWAFQVKCL
uniref:Polymerase nucleotidyl transferase domain-containing protein n=1 Tax=Panagrolaimus sp. ES5 TaxID=591445 RepID=A0AC34FJQ7_9BILA